MSDTDLVVVHDSAATNTIPGSQVHVDLDMTPICENMSNKEFRECITRARDAAVPLIQTRLKALDKWDQSEQARVRKWFGRSDGETRKILQTGMPKLLETMRNLKPDHVVRWDQQKQRNVTCTVFPDNGSTDAAICKPDSVRRMIAIYPHFCTSPEAQLWKGCKVLTLIHECTHFTDVFDSNDSMYGISIGLSFWAQSNPDLAIRNADSLACYVGFEE